MNQREYVLLLLEDPNSWSDEQVAGLLANSYEIKSTLYGLWRSFPGSAERVQRYRARKKELLALPNEELLARSRAISEDRAAAMAADPDDTELPDSFFESPPIDSDQYIIGEILEEQKAAQNV